MIGWLPRLKAAGVAGKRRTSCVVGAKLLILPAYSPDLNPIDQVFAKLKTFLRKIDARTIETAWRGIG